MSTTDKAKESPETQCAAQQGPSPAMDRRDFLVSSASAGAGLMLAGGAAAQDTPKPKAGAIPEPKSSDQVNIAMIGLGAEGMVLMEAILRIPGIRVQAVCDIWEYSRQRGSRTLKKYSHPGTPYVDYQDMLEAETDLDAVVVATPDFVHADHTIASLEKGLHVYCEKEMSNSIEKARQMVMAARETGKLLQIGHQRRSNPRYHHAVDRLVRGSGLLGRVTHANAQWNRGKSEDLHWPPKYEMDQKTLDKYGYESMQHFRNWRWYKKYGGGPIVDLGSHQIDIFAWVFGTNPQSVLAGGGVDFYPHHEWYDNVMAIFEYETDAGMSRAFYQVLTTSSNGSYYETFMGENGTLVISEMSARGNQMLLEKTVPGNIEELWNQAAREGALSKPDPPAARADIADIMVDVRESPVPESWGLTVELNKPAHQPHLENFFDAIRIGTPLSCPAEIGYETAVAVLKVNEAVDAGHKLAFTPEEFEV